MGSGARMRLGSLFSEWDQTLGRPGGGHSSGLGSSLRGLGSGSQVLGKVASWATSEAELTSLGNHLQRGWWGRRSQR